MDLPVRGQQLSFYCTFTALHCKSLIIDGAGEGNRKHPPRFFNFHQNTPKTAYLLRIIEVSGLGQQEPISHENAPNRKKVVSNCQQNREGLRECRP
jgi:hypothetical protein